MQPLLILALLCFVSAAAADDLSVSICHEQRMCSECMQAHPSCSWCKSVDFSGRSRCDSLANLQKFECTETQSFDSMVITEHDRELGSISDRTGQALQIRPQRVRLDLAPGSTLTFPVLYEHRDKRMDIYLINSNIEGTGVGLNYSVDCNGQKIESNKCANVADGARVQFDVSVTVTRAICAQSQHRGGVIFSLGMSGVREPLAVIVVPQCGCDCEKLSQQEQSSPTCNGKGALVCGQCQCDSTTAGKTCDCPVPIEMSKSEMLDKCRNPDSNQVCSGVGQCQCGACVCIDPLYVGDFCECDNASCPKVDGLLCSDHGDCECGECFCESPWTGPDCACRPDKHCYNADTGEMCSGRGDCDCGVCSCRDDWHGDACELCPTCEPEATTPYSPHMGTNTCRRATTSLFLALVPTLFGR